MEDRIRESDERLDEKMRRSRLLIGVLTCLVLALGLTACGKGSSESNTENSTEQTVNTTTESSTESTSKVTETEQKETAGSEEETSSATGSETSNPESRKDTLVVVFSATGTTKSIAEKIAKYTDADYYEITAAIPYSDEDRDWTNSDSRCTKEQNDTSVRPEISSEKISLDGYTTIYIGYPIWFGQEPRIMDTFVESYNFDGITMIPFCTSGSSGIGSSGKNLAANAGSGNWVDGKRFAGNATEEEIKEWVDSMGNQMLLKINGTEVPVIWESNDSIKELKGIADGGLTIEMSMYGGFEQVGPIGKSIISNDEQTTTSPGDIVLYSGNQIVIFYGSNSWAYTRLGKIDLSEEELRNLLSNGDVTITLTLHY